MEESRFIKVKVPKSFCNVRVVPLEDEAYQVSVCTFYRFGGKCIKYDKKLAFKDKKYIPCRQCLKDTIKENFDGKRAE